MKRIHMNLEPTVMAVVLALAACSASSGHAADLNAGQAKAKEVCAACHGLDGNSQVPDYPKIGGQYPDYLAKALRDYKSGLRKNPIMSGMVAALSVRDINNLAAYYASQPQTVRGVVK